MNTSRLSRVLISSLTAAILVVSGAGAALAYPDTTDPGGTGQQPSDPTHGSHGMVCKHGNSYVDGLIELAHDPRCPVGKSDQGSYPTDGYDWSVVETIDIRKQPIKYITTGYQMWRFYEKDGQVIGWSRSRINVKEWSYSNPGLGSLLVPNPEDFNIPISNPSVAGVFEGRSGDGWGGVRKAQGLDFQEDYRIQAQTGKAIPLAPEYTFTNGVGRMIQVDPANDPYAMNLTPGNPDAPKTQTDLYNYYNTILRKSGSPMVASVIANLSGPPSSPADVQYGDGVNLSSPLDVRGPDVGKSTPVTETGYCYIPLMSQVVDFGVNNAQAMNGKRYAVVVNPVFTDSPRYDLTGERLANTDAPNYYAGPFMFGSGKTDKVYQNWRTIIRGDTDGYTKKLYFEDGGSVTVRPLGPGMTSGAESADYAAENVKCVRSMVTGASTYTAAPAAPIPPQPKFESDIPRVAQVGGKLRQSTTKIKTSVAAGPGITDVRFTYHISISPMNPSIYSQCGVSVSNCDYQLRDGSDSGRVLNGKEWTFVTNGAPTTNVFNSRYFKATQAGNDFVVKVGDWRIDYSVESLASGSFTVFLTTPTGEEYHQTFNYSNPCVPTSHPFTNYRWAVNKKTGVPYLEPYPDVQVTCDPPDKLRNQHVQDSAMRMYGQPYPVIGSTNTSD